MKENMMMMLMRSSSASIDLHFSETTKFDEGDIKCIVNIKSCGSLTYDVNNKDFEVFE